MPGQARSCRTPRRQRGGACPASTCSRSTSPAREARPCAPPTFVDQLHEVLDLSTDQVTVLDGVPIVRPERAIFELCATTHPLRAERALDTGWSKALYSGDSLRRIHRELACRGRGGTVSSCASCSAPVDPAGSRRLPTWRPRFETIMRGALLGTWRRQVDLGDDARWCRARRLRSRPRGRSSSRCRASATTRRSATRRTTSFVGSDSRTPGSSSSRCGIARSGTPGTRSSPRSGTASPEPRRASTPPEPCSCIYRCCAIAQRSDARTGGRRVSVAARAGRHRARSAAVAGPANRRDDRRLRRRARRPPGRDRAGQGSRPTGAGALRGADVRSSSGRDRAPGVGPQAAHQPRAAARTARGQRRGRDRRRCTSTRPSRRSRRSRSSSGC